LNEDLEAFKSQNESLKISIREIQDCCIKYEKEIEKQNQLIEKLENRNMSLNDSNQTLKVEIQKKESGSSWIKQFVPNFFMPKHSGDIENSYNISISDSESDSHSNKNQN
jgi:exonuclease VII small subunit